MAKSKNKPPPPAPPRPWTPELQADLERFLAVGEECISESELRGLISAKGRGTEQYAEEGGEGKDGEADGEREEKVDRSPRIRLYDGFEPSGRMHIAQGLLKSVNVNRCTFPGTHSTFCFWVADWFALMNDKMGGDLDKIVTVGKYLRPRATSFRRGGSAFVFEQGRHGATRRPTRALERGRFRTIRRRRKSMHGVVFPTFGAGGRREEDVPAPVRRIFSVPRGCFELWFCRRDVVDRISRGECFAGSAYEPEAEEFELTRGTRILRPRNDLGRGLRAKAVGVAKAGARASVGRDECSRGQERWDGEDDGKTTPNTAAFVVFRTLRGP